LYEDDIPVDVQATVLEQNIQSPVVTDMLDKFYLFPKYLYTDNYDSVKAARLLSYDLARNYL